MSLPFDYDQLAVGEFGGTTPTTTDFENARVVILPVPLDRTTSYVAGTRNGQHEILVASSHMELWDEETQTDVHSVGIFTLPEMEFPYGSMDDVVREIRRVTGELVNLSTATTTFSQLRAQQDTMTGQSSIGQVILRRQK